ncbi:MAG: hypothetical protein LBI02_00255 [Opitutaceae bacterium]|jgi:hypothetical protein|nr:hypothetical protein [Opitutaceae bacterium]
MKTARNIIAICLAGLLPALAHAQNDNDAPAASPDGGTAPINPDEINQLAAAPTAGERVEQERDAYLKEQNITLGVQDKKGRIFYYAQQAVGVPATDARWGRARILAHDGALLAAQTEFLRDRFGAQTVEIARTYFNQENNDGADEFPEEAVKNPKGTLEAIAKKVAVLAEAKLDSALEKEGVDPAQYNNLPPAQKKTLFMDQLVKNTINKAVGDASGLTTVQSFTGNDEAGNYVVGVIMMYSPDLRQLAYDISHKKPSLITGRPKKSIQDMIPTDGEMLNEALGLRVGFDSNGRPCVISFGQWSSDYNGKDARRAERAREAASRVALTQADAYITTFQNAGMSFLDTTSVGQSVERTLAKAPDGNITDVDTTKLMEIINEKTRLTARADMLGRATVKRWSYVTPGGHRMSGVVRAWTLENLEAGQAVRNWKPSTKPAATPAASSAGKQEEAAGVKRGFGQDLNDF